MVVLNKILTTMEEKKISQKELCNALKINGQAFTNWKNGHTKSYKKYLPQIAEFLGVSVDYLLGKKEKPTYEGELSESRKQLIDFAMSVSEEKAELLLRIMKTIAEDEQ